MKKLFRFALAILIVVALVMPAFAYFGDVRQNPQLYTTVNGATAVPTAPGSSGATMVTGSHTIISGITVVSQSTAGYLLGVYNENNRNGNNEAAADCVFEAEVPGAASTSGRLNYYNLTEMPIDCPNGIVIMVSDVAITGSVIFYQPK